jgi:predicted acyl esterase
MLRSFSMTLAGTSVAVIAAALLTPATGMATAVGATDLGAVDTYTGLSFTVPAGLDDQGRPQTCVIDADLYKPHTASTANRVPTILTTNGFGGSKGDQSGLGRAFAQRGYAVLSYTGLGFPNSGCKISLDDPAVDGVAASHLVTFLGGGGSAPYASSDVAGAPGGSGSLTVDFSKLDNAAAHDPRVGMIGGSYGGQIQFATAAMDPRVDTLVPLITWNDLRYSLAPNNTAQSSGVTYAEQTPGTEKIGWSSLFFGVGIADGIEGVSIDPTREVGCPNFVIQVCQAKATLDTLGYPTAQTYALTDRVSVGHYLDRVRVPTFLIQGQNDTLFNLQEAVATFRDLRARKVPVSMAWQSWGHSGGMNGNSGAAPGELDLSGANIEDTYLGLRIKNWFDHYLKDVKAAPTGPAFSYFRDWVKYTGTAAPAYGSASSYPVGAQREYYLSGSGDLVATPAAVKPGSVSWSNPGLGAFGSYSEVSGLEGQIPAGSLPPNTTAPYDAPGTMGAWTTQGLTTDADIVGVPTLDVTFIAPTVAATQTAGPAGKLQVFAKLYDVAPDGSKTLVNKLISPVRVADVTKSVHIELPGIVHRVVAGHRIQLVLASTDAAYKNAYSVQFVTITASPAALATLRIPIVG